MEKLTGSIIYLKEVTTPRLRAGVGALQAASLPTAVGRLCVRANTRQLPSHDASSSFTTIYSLCVDSATSEGKPLFKRIDLIASQPSELITLRVFFFLGLLLPLHHSFSFHSSCGSPTRELRRIRRQAARPACCRVRNSHIQQLLSFFVTEMGAACGKNKAKQPSKRADPRELEETTRKEAEEKAAAEAAAREAEQRAKAEAEAAAAAAAKAREEEERAKAEAAAAAAAATAAAAAEQAREEQARAAEQAEAEAARHQQEEEERKAAEAERLAAEEESRKQADKEAALAQQELEEKTPRTAEPVEVREPEPEYPEKEKQIPAEDVASEATMETSRQLRKVSEPEYGAAHTGRKARTVTPCDMTALDETSMYVSKRCGCHLGAEHDENACLICQSIDLSDAPLLN
ncbi:hypothetical protein ACSSS7_005379 [Eimeria intestinalis]